MNHFSVFCPMTFIALFCTAIFAENQDADTPASQPQERVIESSDYLKEMLPKIEKVAKALKEKSFYLQVSPVPLKEETDHCRETVEELQRFLRDTAHTLVFSSFINQPIRVNWQRKDRAELFLAILKAVGDAIDPDYKDIFSGGPRGQMNVYPIPDESDDTGQFFLPNMLPEDIKHPKTRENYMIASWENSKIIMNSSMHRDLTEIQSKIPRSFHWHAIRDYAQEPHADQELIYLLERYDYPEAERIKLLADLEDYRHRQSTAVLVEPPPAGVHELQEGEVRNPDGSVSKTTVTTIEISRDKLYETHEIYPLPERSSRWKTVLLVNGAIICALLALYFYFRWRKTCSAF